MFADQPHVCSAHYRPQGGRTCRVTCKSFPGPENTYASQPGFLCQPLAVLLFSLWDRRAGPTGQFPSPARVLFAPVGKNGNWAIEQSQTTFSRPSSVRLPLRRWNNPRREIDRCHSEN